MLNVIKRAEAAPVAATARRLREDELQALWPQLLRIYPAWQDYRERTIREFRAFHLTPAS